MQIKYNLAFPVNDSLTYIVIILFFTAHRKHDPTNCPLFLFYFPLPRFLSPSTSPPQTAVAAVRREILYFLNILFFLHSLSFLTASNESSSLKIRNVSTQCIVCINELFVQSPDRSHTCNAIPEKFDVLNGYNCDSFFKCQLTNGNRARTQQSDLR